jgi:hypothetical protein
MILHNATCNIDNSKSGDIGQGNDPRSIDKFVERDLSHHLRSSIYSPRCARCLFILWFFGSLVHASNLSTISIFHIRIAVSVPDIHAVLLAFPAYVSVTRI